MRIAAKNKKILTKGIVDDFEVLTLNTVELYASKINALLSRATPRDLYDVNAMIENGLIAKDAEEMLRKCLIFYNSIGGDYPLDALTYENVEKLDFRKFKTQLKPVIAKDDKFDIVKAKTKSIEYLKELIVLSKQETEYLSEFQEKKYRPELLFDEENVINNIKLHPAAMWRCMDH